MRGEIRVEATSAVSQRSLLPEAIIAPNGIAPYETLHCARLIEPFIGCFDTGRSGKDMPCGRRSVKYLNGSSLE
jgi:hypothetical protein